MVNKAKELLIRKDGRINTRKVMNDFAWLRKNHKSVYDDIFAKTDFLDNSTDQKTRLYAYFNNYTEPQECVVCGQKHFRYIRETNTISDCCSIQCSLKNPHRAEKISRTKIEKFHRGHWRDEILADAEKLEKYIIEQAEKNPHKAARQMGVTPRIILNRVHLYNLQHLLHNSYFIPDSSSRGENEIVDFLKSELGLNDIETRNRTILSDNKELDIYIPSLNVAIEFDGVFWHCEENGKDRYYHLSKTNECEMKGIQLFHIFDNEWNNPTKKEIWKSLLQHKANKSQTKIYARNCSIIKNINNTFKNEFLLNNHLQGKDNSNIIYGLCDGKEIVAMMSFVKSRFTQKYDWELSRFCSKNNYSIVGAASRLLESFKKDYGGTIVSYANRRWSQGNLYRKLGFSYSHTSKPNYFYTKDFICLESRHKYQKHKLKELLSSYDESLTENENMKKNGFYRIWDCGNLVFALFN